MRGWAGLGLGILLAGGLAGTAVAQSAPAAPPSEPETRIFVRDLVDPASGEHWHLYRGTGAGPGRLVRIDSTSALEQQVPTAARPLLVVHAGDPVIVEEHTPVMDLRLEAIALRSAAVGSELTVRLKYSGQIVHVKAVDSRLTIILPAGAETR